MVAMVAMANHRADSPKTGWRIGVDTSRSTTHRVCVSAHAFASCGGGRGEYLLTRRVWSAHGARRSSQRTQGGSCAVWGAQRLPKNWRRTTSGTPARARACRVASRMSAPSLPKVRGVLHDHLYDVVRPLEALFSARDSHREAGRLESAASTAFRAILHPLPSRRDGHAARVRGGPWRRRGRCHSTRCAVPGHWSTC